RGLTLDDQIVASPFATDGTAGGGPPTNYTLQGQFTQLTVANGFDTEGQFEDVVVDIDALATANGDFNPADVIAIGIQIGYNGAIGAESTHTVSVLLDSITFSSGVTNVTFTNDAEGLVLTQFGVQTAEVIHH
ncbi:MAG TPA: hypothetical protein VNN80_15400, partial [Polyangiaceae bacterium]|nr:hypothetical protein [Polyangiaceae bacterium]